MTNTENITENITDTERADILAGLQELRRRPNKLSTLLGPPEKTYRHQMRLTAVENASLKLIHVALSMHVGRAVTLALVHRLALHLLLDQCKASLKDPAIAARLKALLLQVREERKHGQ